MGSGILGPNEVLILYNRLETMWDKSIYFLMIWSKLTKWEVKELRDPKYENYFSSGELDIWRSIPYGVGTI